MSSTNKRGIVSQGDTPGKPKSKTHRIGSGREERSSKKSSGFETLAKIKLKVKHLHGQKKKSRGGQNLLLIIIVLIPLMKKAFG